MVAPNMVSLHLRKCVLTILVAGVAATSLGGRSSKQISSKPAPFYKYVVADSDATVFDFSGSPFIEASNAFLNFSHEVGRTKHAHLEAMSATDNFQKDILGAHNMVRKRGGVPALKWSEDLQEIATTHVLKLANKGCDIHHSALPDRWNDPVFEYVGENLYKVINRRPTGLEVVDAWYAEIEDYSYGLVGSTCTQAKGHPRSVGHFTQVMWAKSTHVGCALAECPDQAQRTFLSVCNYGPGGNVMGQYPFPSSTSTTLGLGTKDCRLMTKSSKKLRSGSHPEDSTKPFFTTLVSSVVSAAGEALKTVALLGTWPCIFNPHSNFRPGQFWQVLARHALRLGFKL